MKNKSAYNRYKSIFRKKVFYIFDKVLLINTLIFLKFRFDFQKWDAARRPPSNYSFGLKSKIVRNNHKIQTN